MEQPMKTPSFNSVTCTDNNGKVWPSWLTAMWWSKKDWTTVGTSTGERMSEMDMSDVAWMNLDPSL